MDDEYRVRLLATLPKLELLDLVPVPDYERAMVNRVSVSLSSSSCTHSYRGVVLCTAYWRWRSRRCFG